MPETHICPECGAEHDLQPCRADATTDSCDCCRAILREIEAAAETTDL